MNAKEMFKALGYTYRESKSIINYQSPDNFIDIWKGLGQIKIAGMPITINTLKAVNQQCKELGWIE